MRWAIRSALAAALLAGVTTAGFSAMPKNDPAPFDRLIGKKLVSIQGATLVMMRSDGELAREIVAADGAAQTSLFNFINDRLGMVTSATDTNKVTGMFRTIEAGLEIRYADGSTEK